MQLLVSSAAGSPLLPYSSLLFKGSKMKNCFFLGLALAVVVGISANESHARGGGGGHGGGGGREFGGGGSYRGEERGGDGFRSGENGFENAGENRGAAQRIETHNPGNVAGQDGRSLSQAKGNFANKNKPFSPAWYANHPNAWQYTHPNANVWAAATFGGAATWLGLSALDSGTGVVNDNGTVYTSDSDDSGDNTSGNDETDNSQENGSQAADESEDSDDSAELAEELAHSGAVDLPADTTFLPLGVYSLVAASHEDASALVQLSVSKDGVLRGSYYDLMSDEGQKIQGAVDKKTQRVAWTIGANGRVVFETSLSDLTQATGPVSLYFENGQTREWNLTRLEETPAQLNQQK